MALSEKQILNLKKNYFKKGHTVWLGRHHSEETKEKKRKIMLERKKKLGYIVSKDARKKISKSLKGNNNPSKRLDVKEKISKANKNKKLSDSHKSKISITISRIQQKENNPNWKGGVTSKNEAERKSNQYNEWREKVFKRDNYTCQKTKIKGGELHPHHIQNFADYPELRFETSNGISLSKKSHNEFHRRYGWRKNTREQLKEFLNS